MTYTEQLKIFYDVSFTDREDFVAEDSSELLRWALSSILLGKPVEKSSAWLASQAAKPLTGDKALIRFFRFVNHAALQKLFAADASQNIASALELLPALEKELMFDTDSALYKETAIGLSMVKDDREQVDFWRKRRFAQEVFEGWKANSFEVLYSSSETASTESLENLSRAAARVSVKTLQDRFLSSVAPVVLSLAAHAENNKTTVARLLEEKISALDQAVFRNDKAPKITFSKPTSRLTAPKPGTALFRLTQAVEGDGVLTTGDYEFEALTTGFVPLAAKAFEKRKTADAFEHIEIEGILKLSEHIEIDDFQLESLQNRMRVAAEHAVNYLELTARNVTGRIKIVKQ